MPEAKFPLGHVVATPGALAALSEADVSGVSLLARHHAGDWGDVPASDKRANDRDLAGGGRLLSSYTLATGVKVWVITEADRSSTCILLPEEY